MVRDKAEQRERERVNNNMQLTVFIALLQWTQAQREIVPLDYFDGK